MRSPSSFGLVVLLFLSVSAFGQSTAREPISTDEELLSALYSLKPGDESAASTLLTNHASLITKRLCTSLAQSAMWSLELGRPGRAPFLSAIAEEAASQLSDKRVLAFVLYQAGRLQFQQDNIKQAITEYLRSKSLFESAGSLRDLIYVLAELGKAHIFVSTYVKAEEYSRQSLAVAESMKDSKEPAGELPDEHGMALAWSNLGNIARWQGGWNTALQDFERALALWQELTRRGYVMVDAPAGAMDALADMGHVYLAIGNHRQALNYLDQALNLAKKVGEPGRTAGALNDIGIVYIEQNDYEKAREFVGQSLKMFTQLHVRREIARTLSNLGVIDYRQKQYGAARQKFEESLERAELIGADEVAIAAREGLGSVYQAQHDYAKASECYERAWSHAQGIGDKIRMTELLWRKGQVFLAQGDYARSNDTAARAAELAIGLQSPLLTYLSLTLKGESYRGQKVDDLACQSFLQAIEAMEHMRDQVAGGETEQELFFENKVSAYHEMVEVLLNQGKTEEALKFAERAKGRVLLDVLRNGRTVASKSLTSDEESNERRLYGEMVSLNTQIRAERMRQQPDLARIGGLETRLHRARGAYEAFQATLYSAHPELKSKRGLFPSFTMEDAGAAIPDARTAVLEYVVTGEQTFLFVLTKDTQNQTKVRLEVHAIKIKGSDLVDLAEKYRSLLSSNDLRFRQIGVELYDLLIKPAEKTLTGKATLCIVPDGPLWNLPFQALQTAGDKYLLELYAIYYAPSLQVLKRMKRRSDSLQSSPLGNGRQSGKPLPSDAHALQLFAVGNPAFGGGALAQAQARRSSPFASIPETEQEVRVLAAEVYGLERSSVRIGAAATEDTVKAEMGKYPVLHFATHGVLDDRNPLYSYIVLSPSADSKEDGLLEAWELMEMDLKAELVVLSACDTARGRVGDGEGMIGMTWALFVAGVPTLVASQWEVPSQSTTRLMIAFHKHLRAGASEKRLSKAEAWRRAALEMITDPRYRNNPYDWAGFVVVGDGE